MSFHVLRAAASVHALVLATALVSPALAQSGPLAVADAASSDTIIVTARPDPEDPAVVADARARLSETPGSVAVVSSESYANRSATGLVDILRDVPGVYIQKKWGGDTRLSIRGSGIGNANHLRGMLVAQDGIPLNEADGYGDTQMVDPSTARFTEVYKGGNALRFGGSLLGGAINIVTPNGKTVSSPNLVRVEVGENTTARAHASAGRTFGDWDVFGAATTATTDGWRNNSSGQLHYVSSNLGYTFGDDREVRFYVTGSQIDQWIPGSLTLTQALNNPETANPTNVTQKYQRNIEALRGALQTRWRLSDTMVAEGGVYATWKDLDHPIFQVIDQESRNWGAFGRIDQELQVAGFDADLFYGAYYRSGDLDANQWQNSQGVRGSRTAQSRQNATGLDLFAEGRLFVTDSLAVIAGGSYGRAERDYQSYPPSAVVVTDSETYDWFAPRLGLMWQNEQGMQVYGNITRSVEPPNFSSLAPTQVGGFQPLKAQDAITAEIGTRGRTGNLVWDVAYYRAEIENELLAYTADPSAGIPAPTFNALDGTMHQGLEAGLDWTFADGWRLRQTYMWSDFRFTGDRQYGDNRLPVVPEHVYKAELRYQHAAGWFIAPSVEWIMEDYFVDFQNTTKAPAFSVASLGAGWAFDGGVTAFVDVRNVFDERYVSNATGVVAANAASAIYFPGDARTVVVGLSVGF